MIKVGEHKPINLIAGLTPTVTQQETLKAGFFYKVGSVLAKQKDDICCLIDSSSTDINITEVYGVLAHDVDATSGNAGGVVYLSGEFNKYALVFGGKDSWKDHIKSARDKNIYFSDVAKVQEFN